MTPPKRESMPATRRSITKKFKLAYVHKDGTPDVMKFYFTVGMYDDGRPGEVFVHADKTGTLASGALDAVAIMMSVALQHGVPLDVLTEKLKGMRFNPSGFTGGDPEIPSCTSPLDLLARWLELKFPPQPKDG